MKSMPSIYATNSLLNNVLDEILQRIMKNFENNKCYSFSFVYCLFFGMFHYALILLVYLLIYNTCIYFTFFIANFFISTKQLNLCHWNEILTDNTII